MQRLHNKVQPAPEHFDVDPIELVEARPGAARRQPLEELAHGNVVQPVRAVEDHALHGERLGQVLGGLGLARAGGACGRATQDLQGRGERGVKGMDGGE